MKKNLIKRLFGAAAALAMAVSLLPSAMAAEVEYGNAVNWSGSSTHIVTTGEHHSGNASLRLKGEGNGSELLQNVDYDPNTTYLVTLYVKLNPDLYNWGGESWLSNAKAWLGSESVLAANGVQHLNDLSGWTKTVKDENGWIKFESRYKPGDAEGKFFHIKNQANAAAAGFEAWIDDLEVYALDSEGNITGDNLIRNGGFEEYTPIKPNVTVTPGDGQLAVSWTNPPVESTSLKVYLDDAEVNTTGLDLSASAVNSVTLTGLENFRSYSVRVEAETAAYGVLSNTVVGTTKALLIGNAVNWSGSNIYIVTTEDSYSGNASLRLKGKGDGYELLQNVEYDPNTTYLVTLYAKLHPDLYDWGGVIWLSNAKAWLGSEGMLNANGVEHLNDTNGWTRTEKDANGWMKYEAKYKPGDDSPKFFHIKNSSSDPGFVAWIDDLSVYALDSEGNVTGDNLIQNGGFEEYTTFTPSMALTSGDSEIKVDWTNPPVAATAAKVYLDGEEVSASGIDLTASAANSITLTGLKNFKTYTVKVSLATAYGDMSAEKSAMPRITELGQPASWRGNDSYVVTTEDSYSGKAALRMSGLKDDSELLQDFDYDTDTFYRASLYAKVKPNFDYKWMIKAWLGLEETTGVNHVQHLNDSGWTMGEVDENGWAKFTSEFKPGDDLGKFFHIKNQADNQVFYGLVDDLEVYALDSDGNVTGENLIKNGGFEEYTAFNHEEGVKYGYVNSDEEALYWTINENANPSYFKIYTLTDGELVNIGQTESGSDNYFIPESFDADARYVVTSVYSATNTETAGVELKDEVIVSGIFGTGTLADDGTVTIDKELSDIQSGTIFAGAEIINNTTAEINPNVYIALYSGTKLVSIQKLAADMAARDNDTGDTKEVKLAAGVNVPEGGNYNIKVMTWKNGEMTPLGGTNILN